MSRRAKAKAREKNDEDKKGAARQNILNPILPKTVGQENFLNAISNYEIVICDGPSGSGKTLLSFGSALNFYFNNKDILKVVIIRPNVAAGDDSDLGFLPGSINEKMSPFLAPIIRDSAPLLLKQSSFRTNMNYNDRGSPDPLSALLAKINIEVVPLSYLRGRTFNNSFIILDEAQNCTMNDFKLFLTRIGKNSKAVIEGDSSQTDIHNSGFKKLQDKLADISEIKLVKLEYFDIIRNPIIAKILEKFD